MSPQSAIEHASQLAQKTGAAVAVPTGIWGFIGTHYQQISAVCAVVGVLVAITGLWVNVWHKRRMQRLREIEIENQKINGG